MKYLRLLLGSLMFILVFNINILAANKYISMNLEYDGGVHYYNAEEIKLFINNRELTNLTMPPIIFDGYSVVPAREVFEAFGANVIWIKDSEQVKIIHENKEVVLTINSNVADVNGVAQTMQIPAKIINDKTMIPLRFVAEAINKEVKWDNSTRVANICDVMVTTTEATTQTTTQATTRTTTEATTQSTTQTTTYKEIMVNGVSVNSSTNADLVVINTSDRAKVSTVLSQNKDLLTIDIENSTLKGSRGDIQKGKYFNGGFYYQLKDGYVRVSLDLISDIGYDVNIADENITITISPEIVLSGNYSNSSNNSGSAILSNKVRYENYKLIINDTNGIINVNNIVHSDKYMENQYMLTFNTSLASLVNNTTVEVNDDFINSIAVESYAKYSSITFNTAKVIAVDVNKSGGQIIINVLSPRDKYDKIIVLDAGHGAGDNGASGNGLIEKDITLDILQKTVALFEKDGKIKAYATRQTDVKPSFDERTDLANQVGDAFVSIHINSAENTSANGTETFCLYPNDTGSGLNSYTLAETILNNLISQLGTNNRGVKSNNLIVLRQSQIPATLIEIGFISNSEEASTVLAPDYQRQKTAQAIFDSVTELFDTYKPVR